MSTEARLKAPDELKLGLMVSLLGHLSIILFFIVRAIVFSTDTFESLPAVRVDLVGLPDKIDHNQPMPPPAKPEEPPAKAPAPPSPPPAAKSEPLPTKKQPDAINLDKTKNKQQDALEKLKRMQALEKIQNDVKKENAEAAAAAARAKAGAMKIKGNQLAPGTELVGIDKLAHEEYRNLLDRHIKNHWQLPEWLARKQLKARVLVRIDAQGRLISKQVTKTSGNPDFDESVLEVVDNSVPFPAPPEKFIAKVGAEGIQLEFGSDNQ